MNELHNSPTLGPFYSGWTYILALISDYNRYNMWGEIIYPFENCNGSTIEVWSRYSEVVCTSSGIRTTAVGLLVQ